ncbi:pyridoxamine 5'-phosphate oxidase-domain-containing protein [Xylariaceae sp. FL0594]|nr:pyridoxamine 5'-phosphate oxidase-domain-containing protein [Xylariaceae sp. FL0594]
MSSSTSAPASAAPWRDLFLSHVGTMESPEFTLSTLRRVSSSSSSSFSSSPAAAAHRRSSLVGQPFFPSHYYYPRARTCIFRGLWANLPHNPKNEAVRNPKGVWESDFLTFTTDARMDKMEELWVADEVSGGVDLEMRMLRLGSADAISPPPTDKVGEELWEEGLKREKRDKEGGGGGAGGGAGGGEKRKEEKKEENKFQGSGGGGPVEAVFWPKETGTQWRVRGRAYVLAPDIETSPEGREVVALLKSRMRKLSPPPSSSPSHSFSSSSAAESGQPTWSFTREITAHFGNLSPLMRGSFRNPPPGRPVSLPFDGDGELGQKVTDLEDPVARRNFRVVVIVPEELDQADLSDPERPRRWIHTYLPGGKGASGRGVVKGDWETVEVWP